LLNKSQTGLLFSILMAACMWFYVQHVLIAYQQAEAVLNGRPRGNLSDLYPRWLGARELILHHRNPYSHEITREIQTGYYGRPIDPARPGDPKDQQGFVYPVYVVFLLAPIIKTPFPIVQECFRWTLGIAVALTVLFWLRTLRWSPSLSSVGILLLLTLSSFPVLQGIKLQQLTLLVSGLIAASIVLISGGHLLAAGLGLELLDYHGPSANWGAVDFAGLDHRISKGTIRVPPVHRPFRISIGCAHACGMGQRFDYSNPARVGLDLLAST
jgi:hypothetical protein